MKVTRLGATRPFVSTASLSGGGGSITDVAPSSGLVPTSNGSNSWAWGSNVATIWVNGTQQVLGPAVNFANGSNTTVSVDLVGSMPSNTIRIHATAGAVSYGSNSNEVSYANAPGVATEVSRVDHVHRGVTSVSHSSNTFTGPVILAPGGGMAITSPVSGTFTLHSSGGGGGGSVDFDEYGPSDEYRPDRPPVSPSAEDDEFDDGSVAGAWAWSGTPPATTDETTFPGKLHIVTSASVGAQNFRRTYVPGTGVAFVIATKLAWSHLNWATHSFQFGLVVATSADAVISEIVLLDDAAGAPGGYRIFDTHGATTRTITAPSGSPVYLAIGRDTGDLYSTWWSVNGYTWIRLGLSGAITTTVDKIGLRIRVNATGNDRYIWADWFRRFAVTAGATMKVGS